MPEINVTIDAATINREITEAIAKSAIGDQLKKQIEEEVKRLSNSWDNPLKGVVEKHVRDICVDLMTTKYKEHIRKLVETQLTDEMIEKIVTKLWETKMW
jgi:hypothetical protein